MLQIIAVAYNKILYIHIENVSNVSQTQVTNARATQHTRCGTRARPAFLPSSKNSIKHLFEFHVVDNKPSKVSS